MPIGMPETGLNACLIKRLSGKRLLGYGVYNINDYAVIHNGRLTIDPGCVDSIRLRRCIKGNGGI